MKNYLNRILSWASILFLLLFFPVYDTFASAGSRWLLSIVVAATLAASGVLSFLGSKKEERETNLSLASGLGLLSLGLYFLRIYLEDLSIQKGSSAEWIGSLREFLLVFLVLSVLGSAALGLLREWERASAENQSSLKGKKQSLIRDFFLGAGILLLAVILANYISVIKNHNFDLSSKGQFSFSPEAKKILKEIPEGAEVDVIAFYPRPLENAPSSDKSNSLALRRVRPDLEILLGQLGSIHPGFKVKFVNADVELDELAEFGQVSNGNVLVRFRKKDAKAGPYPEQKVSVKDKTELEEFERKLVQAFMNVTTKERKVYFTQSNGERYSAVFQNLPNEKLTRLSAGLSFLNYRLSGIGFKENWPPKIPEDTDILVIIGPTVPFGPEARQAILEYFNQKKGKLFITIEPKGGETFDWLLENSGQTFVKETLSQIPSQPGIVITKAFRKHAIEESLSKKDLGVVYPYSGYFQSKASAEPKSKSNDSYVLLESGGESYSDKNGNGKQDAGDDNKNVPLALLLRTVEETKASAVNQDPNQPPAPAENKSGNEGRAVIFSGTSWLTDQYIPYAANYELASSSATWLHQDVSLPAIPPKKEEIESVSLTDGQKRAVWILGMFVFPGLIAGLGSIYVVRRRRGRDSE
ncbi:Gldg family protein [Leptospira wolffii]|uniref:Gldg family protein n=1 Tax=Leptospira wolffii TaxID=409998 RepID=UPI0002EF16BC|nr:Gldg family protein [Leptospira wolffii]EPG64780.1 putative membrane protein [Leptospira wolffii serovar Khorat str. Khorat-H2]